jgi:formylglycine-generating enzyme required for sulfatase activity
MKSPVKKIQITCFLFIILSYVAQSQKLTDFRNNSLTGITVDQLSVSEGTPLTFTKSRPLFSFLLNNKILNTSGSVIARKDNILSQEFNNTLRVTTATVKDSINALRLEIIFENTGNDTIRLSNVVPFGEDSVNSVHITGKGPWDLARAWLSRPGYRPVRVILPDNAWELGYTSFKISENISVCAIARRFKFDGAQRQRYETVMPPKSKVYYNMYAETFKGEWQNGLRLIFRDRYLYDLAYFNNSLYERKDLDWIKHAYLIVLQMAWDREFYDRLSGKYNYAEVIKKGIAQFGKIDVFCIWPTWPRLGLDQRNQWDLYRDLPGGTRQIRNFANMSQQAGTKFFISYNPWDNSTRTEDHYKGMAGMIAETDADGVVLDTQGSSSSELQAAADGVRKGVIMYSEGMAVTKDMPGIISGRVHNAIFFSPELNLNKLIKPDFSIFRVCDVGEDLIHRELAIAFFNGYGSELNMYRPGGRDDFYREDMAYLGRTTMILRQNNDAFLDQDWTPFIDTREDNVFVNKWSAGAKTVYTVLNMRPEGINVPLFRGELKSGKHWVSLWNHENIVPSTEKGVSFITARADGWHASYKGTRKEGSVDCIAELPVILKPVLSGDNLSINAFTGKLLIWKGEPSYSSQPREMTLKKDTVLRVRDLFGYYEGKVVLQLLENNVLIDESIIDIPGGKPWLISKVTKTEGASSVPENMVLVSGRSFSFRVTANDDFMPYPDVNDKISVIDSFLIDKYPVTNAQYYEFLMSSGYRPADTARFLRHWSGGIYKQGQEKYPVVNLSYEDMNAYARWAGKRLPTEAEWQLAAQGTDKRIWPWGNEFHGAFCNNSFGRLTPVDAFPKGQSPSGAIDMVGNVWQMTGDMYFNGSYYMTVIRGGSFYKPESSWWYVQGGPQQLDKTQVLLMVSPGFDRSSTVGFRCAKDIDHKNFSVKK